MSENFQQLLEQSLSQVKMRPGAIVKAKVICIASNHVIVDAGLKSEGVIPIEEFYNEESELAVAVGDEVDVAIETPEDGFGETILSYERAKRLAAWTYLEKAHQSNETVTGIITERVKGGFTVDISHVKAFLPGSLIDVRPVRDPSYLEGKPIEFKVIKMDLKRNNIVVSRRAVVEQETSSDREALLESLHEGQEVMGVVKNLTEYGAFIDLGGIDGLLHITDISWKRTKHPSEVLTVGQEIKVKILSFDRERNRVSLGIKQLADDPWQALVTRYPVGTKFSGKVTNITDYGCFVEIEDGVEGLVHMSEMDWTNKNIHPSKVVQLGDQVEVMVLEIDEGRRRISLGIKQCQGNPWEAFSAQHAKGDTITGKIRSITDFGIFVGLMGDIDGLIHLSDISWVVPGEQAVKEYKKGQEIEAVVLAIDAERERISLGIKQLKGDPFTDFVDTHGKGTIVTGKVIELDEKEALVELASEVVASLRASEVSGDERVNDISEHLSVDQDIEAVIVNVDKKNRKLQISIKAKDMLEQKEVLKRYSTEAEENKATLGDILKDQMGDKEE